MDDTYSCNWTMEPRPLYSRYAEILLVEALADSPAVLVHGPRQSGKTTLVHLVGEELLDLAYETLTDRSCTYMDSVSEVDDDYEIQVEDYWHTHTDPETGRTLVDRGEEDLWDISYFVGTEGDEVEEEGVDGMLEIVGFSVEGLAQEADSPLQHRAVGWTCFRRESQPNCCESAMIKGLKRPFQRIDKWYSNKATLRRDSIALVYLQWGSIHRRVLGIIAVGGTSDR